jgi:acyl carrier protein phosphodiesterase
VNYLAHCALGSAHPEYLVGGFLGDFIKGAVPGHLPHRIQIGVRLHRRLDAYSANQSDIADSIARLPTSLRRVAPIFIDLLADHFLARNFEVLHGEPLQVFSCRSYRTLAEHQEHFPVPAQRFANFLGEHDLFGRYVRVDAVERAFARIAQRLRLDGIVPAAMSAVADQYDDFEADFLRYYPALQQHADGWLAERCS